MDIKDKLMKTQQYAYMHMEDCSEIRLTNAGRWKQLSCKKGNLEQSIKVHKGVYLMR
jgi:hypothetical protein